MLQSREDRNVAGHSSMARQDSVELGSLEPDVDRQTAHSADALLRRDPSQLTRLESSDRDDDVTTADHDDDEDDEDEEERPGHRPR